MPSVYSPLLEELIEALRCLPGVGRKSAQRMAFHVLNRQRQAGTRLAEVLEEAVRLIGHCERCRMLTERARCGICTDERRDSAKLCVVETPADVAAIEESQGYRGRYFVLMGHLSPIDGIGPEQLGLDQLRDQLEEGAIKEVIIATNATVEGDVTAQVIADYAKQSGVAASRIAHGVPMGGELEFVDGTTLSQALIGRRPVVESQASDG